MHVQTINNQIKIVHDKGSPVVQWSISIKFSYHNYEHDPFRRNIIRGEFWRRGSTTSPGWTSSTLIAMALHTCSTLLQQWTTFNTDVHFHTMTTLYFYLFTCSTHYNMYHIAERLWNDSWIERLETRQGEDLKQILKWFIAQALNVNEGTVVGRIN